MQIPDMVYIPVALVLFVVGCVVSRGTLSVTERECFYSEISRLGQGELPKDCARNVAKSDLDGCWTKVSAVCKPCLKRFWGWDRAYWRSKGML